MYVNELNNLCITYTLLDYSFNCSYLFPDQKRKPGIMKRIQKQICKFELKPEELGFSNSLIMNMENLPTKHLKQNNDFS